MCTQQHPRGDVPPRRPGRQGAVVVEGDEHAQVADLGQVVARRRVEVDQPVFDALQRGGGGEGLGDGEKAQNGVGCRGLAGRERPHARGARRRSARRASVSPATTPGTPFATAAARLSRSALGLVIPLLSVELLGPARSRTRQPIPRGEHEAPNPHEPKPMPRLAPSTREAHHGHMGEGTDPECRGRAAARSRPRLDHRGRASSRPSPSSSAPRTSSRPARRPDRWRSRRRPRHPPPPARRHPPRHRRPDPDADPHSDRPRREHRRPTTPRSLPRTDVFAIHPALPVDADPFGAVTELARPLARRVRPGLRRPGRPAGRRAAPRLCLRRHDGPGDRAPRALGQGAARRPPGAAVAGQPGPAHRVAARPGRRAQPRRRRPST